MRDWSLVADGPAFETPRGRLRPVRWHGRAAMLKISREAEERTGAAWLEWRAGSGAAAVHARSGAALLMERATGRKDLSAMARSGADAAAVDVLCDVLNELHRPGRGAPPATQPLGRWFAALTKTALGDLMPAAATARQLLATQTAFRPLHGDLHFANVLDFGARGWRAIDPKGLTGEPTFDYCCLFLNPDLERVDPPVAVRPEVFARRLTQVSRRARLDPVRLRAWVLACAGLSAAWSIAAGENPQIALRLCRLAEGHG